MNDNQKIFVNEYLIDRNATRAYKAAYPGIKNDNTAAASGNRLLRNDKVAEYIKERMAEKAERTEVKGDDVIRELATIGFAKTTSVNEFEVKTSDKLKALELIARILGMFTDKSEIKATVSIEDYLERLGGDYEY